MIDEKYADELKRQMDEMGLESPQDGMQYGGDFNEYIKTILDDKFIPPGVKAVLWGVLNVDARLTNLQEKDIHNFDGYLDVLHATSMARMPDYSYTFASELGIMNAKAAAELALRRSLGHGERKLQATQIRVTQTDTAGSEEKKKRGIVTGFFSRLFGIGR